MGTNKISILLVIAFCCIGCLADSVESKDLEDVKTENKEEKVEDTKHANYPLLRLIADERKNKLKNTTPKPEIKEGGNKHTQKIKSAPKKKTKLKSEKSVCFTYPKSSKTISQTFDNDAVQRLVVYFYIINEDGVDKHYMYIPGIRKQQQMPDLPIHESDLKFPADELSVKDILNNRNPFILKNNQPLHASGKRKQKKDDMLKINKFKELLPTKCYDKVEDNSMQRYCENHKSVVISKRPYVVPLAVKDNVPNVVPLSDYVSDKTKYVHVLPPAYNNDDSADILEIEEKSIKLIPIKAKDFILDNVGLPIGNVDLPISNVELPTDKEELPIGKADTSYLKNISPSNNFISPGFNNMDIIKDSAFYNIPDSVHQNDVNKDSRQEKESEDWYVNDELLPNQINALDQWLYNQLNENLFQGLPNRNLKMLQSHLKNGLENDGFSVLNREILKDPSGHLYNINNIKLIPVLVATKRLHPNPISTIRTGYMKTILIVTTDPPAILSIIPVDNKWESPQPEKMRHNHINTNTIKSKKGKSKDYWLQNTWKQIGKIIGVKDNAPKKLNWDFRSETCATCGHTTLNVESESDVGVDYNQNSTVAEKDDKLKPGIDSNADNEFKVEKAENEDVLNNKILGGSAALGSGYPISNRGRTGIIEFD